MKLASFMVSGRPSYGIVTEGGIVDLGKRIGKEAPRLIDALSRYAPSELRRYQEPGKVDWKLEDISWQLPIPMPDKIVCVGRNYAAHVAEAAVAAPDFPNLFARFKTSLVPHGEPVVRPKISVEFDYEGELAIVIGKGGSGIAKSVALDHVAGYTCFNDGSVRNYQFKHSLMAGKNFDASGSIGPWIVTADEIPDPTKLVLTTRLNGEEVQKSGIDQMIFGVPELISYISDFITLAVGDIIATGTPEGVGFAKKPPRLLQPGDVFEVDIGGIGVLRNPVIDWSTVPRS